MTSSWRTPIGLGTGPDVDEATRNRLLRRVDWRFLLPDPGAARTVCFTSGELREAVELIAGELREPGARPGDSDLAVVVDPDDATLEAARAELRDGACLYGEWRSPFLSARSLTRRLLLAGFTDVRCYRPWPSLRATAAWLPLGVRGPKSYFLLRHRRLPGQRGALLVNLVRYVARSLPRWAGLPTTLCAVARTPSPSLPSEELDAGPASPGWHWLLLIRGPRSISKVIGLAFRDGSRSPDLVAKIARIPEAAVGLAREAEVLRVLAERPGGVRGVPRVHQVRTAPDRFTVMETPLSGGPLWSVLRPSRYRSLALQATSWLSDLALGGGTPVRSSPARVVRPALDRFGRMFGAVADPGLLQQTSEALAGLPPLPVVPEQRDFSPWNLFVTGDGTLAVLDWESADPEGLPALDLIYFLSYLAFFHDGAMKSRNFLESYRRALDPATFSGRVQEECLTRYGVSLGVGPSEMRRLRLLTWVIHAPSEYRQFEADAGGTPSNDRLRESLFFRLWEEEVRR